jgi:hypothetical protein
LHPDGVVIFPAAVPANHDRLNLPHNSRDTKACQEKTGQKTQNVDMSLLKASTFSGAVTDGPLDSFANLRQT